MHGQPTQATPGASAARRARRSRGRSALAAIPDPREQEQLAVEGRRQAQEVLDAAMAAGRPLTDVTGRQRSPVTLPEYRLGRAPANKGRRYPVEVLTPAEVQAIVDRLPRGRAGVRNRALIIVMWRAGLRVAEALALEPKDVDLELGAITVLEGKGAKRRVVAIDRAAGGYIEAWLAARDTLGLTAGGALFCTIQKGNTGGSMNSSAVREMLKLYARKAGVRKRVHPHGLRHTHAFELSQEDVPVRLIQAQLGHADLAMTARYIDHLSPKQLLERIGSRAWPDSGPPPAPVTVAARSSGEPAPLTEPVREVTLDPPEPKPAGTRGQRAPLGQGPQRVLDALASNGGSATQAQLRRALGLSCPTLLGHLHRLHEQERVIRTGFDRNRSIIWKLAPPPVVMRRRVTDYRQAPPGDGPRRVLDAIEALGGRGSQAEVARMLGLAPTTVHDHCLELAAAGQLERGGLDKSTSHRGSQVWRLPAPRPRYHVAGGYSLKLTVPR